MPCGAASATASVWGILLRGMKRRGLQSSTRPCARAGRGLVGELGRIAAQCPAGTRPCARARTRAPHACPPGAACHHKVCSARGAWLSPSPHPVCTANSDACVSKGLAPLPKQSMRPSALLCCAVLCCGKLCVGVREREPPPQSHAPSNAQEEHPPPPHLLLCLRQCPAHSTCVLTLGQHHGSTVVQRVARAPACEHAGGSVTASVLRVGALSPAAGPEHDGRPAPSSMQ